MQTLIDVLKKAADFLSLKKVSHPRRSAEELLAHALGLASRLDLYLQFDRPLEEKELEIYRALIKRSAAHEPYAYILGKISFYGCELKIDKRALIPRPETEILLNHVVKSLSCKTLVAWDLCTGSGCLGLGLKKAVPEMEVSLSDLSPEALELARENALSNGLEVSFYQGDLLEPFSGKKADLILCNPPYIATGELDALDRSVVGYEPRMALEAPGEKGEAFYQRLADLLPRYLNPEAQIFLEIGKDQGECVRHLFDNKYFKNGKIEKDFAGHDRYFYTCFAGESSC